MAGLDTYRQVRIFVNCTHAEEPLDWTQHTTRTTEQMISYGRAVANTVCQDKSIGHQDTHVVTVVDLEDEPKAVSSA